ncbi:flagellar basal body rod protein FlgB [Halobacteriovorax sp. GB3]|uniref:flagellar basal body rod protein FlgB n=1 Tax=Halobacteriovorax sp. GB3 TaxID=2719615 RepID=UPI00235FD555|nr:flagellar basal body rod protein FlgB [Halobacteriovorax sp. GB3]MDD0852643.1 flagellar basal body rod protein FlgB [Halobacteriovorax sp. GB3]
MISDDKTLQALATSLNFRQMRQEIISSNIANAETPGYKAKRLEFEEALARALDVDGNLSMLTSDEKHHDVGSGGFDNLQPEVVEDSNGIVSEDGNTVDRDAEMAKMAENKIMYDASVQLLNKKLGLMKYAVSSER